MLGGIAPSREEFATRTAAVVPVRRRLLADGETAVGLYRKLAGNRPGTFLLESAEQGRSWSRWSFVGVRCAGVLTERDGRARWLGAGLPTTSDDPLEALEQAEAMLRSAKPEGAPPLTAGLVGYLGYDIVRRLERLPSTAPDEIGMPELAMMLVTDLAVLDHSDGTVLLIANVLPGADPGTAYDNAVARLDVMTADLSEPTEPSVATLDLQARPEVARRTTPEQYMAGVERVREHIRDGDAFQVVLSQRFEVTTEVDALDVYRVLRASNPSPYMYLLRFEGAESPYDVVGSSPEALVTVTGDRAVVHPPAGTRPRGATPEQDVLLAHELRSDPKEQAEHVMLVDLARNDLGRVCVPGTVDVADFMRVEQYSHVMHLVSTVFGQLRPGARALDVLRASFPAGTVSGAPKPSAMTIIESLEPSRRSLYAGTVGYVDVGGDMDMAIAIRTAVLHQGKAYVQAGAGIVADSDPRTEQAECENKAAAVLQAIAAAASLRPAGRHRAGRGGNAAAPSMSRPAAAPRHELALAVGLCVLASAGALIAAGRTWAVGTVGALPPLPARDLALTAAQAGAPVSGLAVLGLAGGVAVVAARGWLRVAVGVLLLFAGVVVAVVGAGFDAGSAFASEGLFPAGAGRTGWPLLAAGCGAGLALAGLLVAVRGRRWSTLSRRYDLPAARVQEAPSQPADTGAQADRELWEALDRGEDPTAP